MAAFPSRVDLVSVYLDLITKESGNPTASEEGAYSGREEEECHKNNLATQVSCLDASSLSQAVGAFQELNE
ncbi:hypothetical protein ILYODFUR_013450 [Ilyodon furcidens]|uniref:Uncharacterized protein n=1 Tax=Ilyodon furcidens TaxID=33524 RepID=A0ABV0V2Q0_9TELE